MGLEPVSREHKLARDYSDCLIMFTDYVYETEEQKKQKLKKERLDKLNDML